MRTGLLAGAGVVGAPFLNLGRSRLFAAGAAPVSVRAIDVVAESMVIDMMGLLTLDWETLFRWQREPVTFGEAEYRRLEASGVRVFHPAVETNARDPYQGARNWLANWNALLSADGCFLVRVRSLVDLLQARRRGALGVIVGFQNSNHFRTVADVEVFHGLGQRVSQLTYNGCNRLGCGAHVAVDSGLTEFGAEIVRAMNRVGMAVDVSHCGERTSRETIAVARKPVLVTHSNCRALVPYQRRNKSDDLIRLVAAAGGVIGITVVRAFVGGTAPTLSDLLDHFDHVARLVGVEHVGLGSDVDLDGVDPATGRTRPPYAIGGLDLSRRVFQLAEGLLERGYTPADVGLVLGGNFQRALADIWSVVPWPNLAERPLRRDPFCPAPAPVGMQVEAGGS